MNFIENLKEVLPSQVKPGTLAIKIGNEIFTPVVL